LSCAETSRTDALDRAGGRRFAADELGISLAKHSRKPPFSLGLQSLLEFLLHKIRVPCVTHCVHETDALIHKHLDQTVVHGMHAVDDSLVELLVDERISLMDAMGHARDPNFVKEEFQKALKSQRKGWFSGMLRK